MEVNAQRVALVPPGQRGLVALRIWQGPAGVVAQGLAGEEREAKRCDVVLLGHGENF